MMKHVFTNQTINIPTLRATRMAQIKARLASNGPSLVKSRKHTTAECLDIYGLISILICCLILCSSYPDTAYAYKTDSISVRYNIMSEGEITGVLTQKLLRNGGRNSLYVQSQIHSSGWWGKVNISSFLVEEIDSVNRLVRSESVDLVGSTIYRSVIEANGNHLLASFVELKEITRSEQEQFTRVVQAVSKIRDKQPENLHSLSTALFEKRGKAAEKVQINVSDFDTTVNHLPFYIQSLGRKPLPKQLRLLDTEDLTINEVSLTDLGDETIALGVKTLRCRHLKMADKKYKPSHIWIDETGRSVPYMVRLTAEDESGAVEISLQE